MAGLLFFALLNGFVLSGIRVNQQQRAIGRELIAPPQGLEHFHFGFASAMADVFWVRAIQDFDYCEMSLSKNLCKGKGWLYQTLDVITLLDPHFRMAYSAGGLALSVIVSDLTGAELLFDRGVENFPNDWVIQYKAAYHALYETKNTGKAAMLMEQAARNGAPDWVFILAGRLYTDSGRREVAERLLADMKGMKLPELVQERLRQKLAEPVQAQPRN